MLRRLVTVDGPDGKSYMLSQAALEHPILDPARPGFALYPVWATEQTPIPIPKKVDFPSSQPSVHPPPHGSLCYLCVLAPDRKAMSRVQAPHTAPLKSPTDSGDGKAPARHPYFRRSTALEFCAVLQGEVTLLLDRQDVILQTAETAILKGVHHAWINHSDRDCVLFISAHGGR